MPSSPFLVVPIAGHARGAQRRLVASLALLAGLVLLAAPPASDAARPTGTGRARVAQVTLTQLKVTGQKVTIRGRATLPRLSAKQRRRTRIALALTNPERKRERFTATLNRRARFAVTRTTKLSGRLSLAVRVRIAGKPVGRALTRTLTVRAVKQGRGRASPGGGSPAGPRGDEPQPRAPAPQGTPLVGTFRIDPGVSHISGTIAGSWFQMLTPTGVPFLNADSRSNDKTFTLLDPGTDGGLRTDAYQPPPTPAFADGAALASRIIQPTKFFGQYFSIVTAPTDPQLGAADPLPAVLNDRGRLSGQVTAWAAQWNNNSFNQGTPKPDGSVPGATTHLAGTYDAATGRYVLEWRSLIVTGPFDSFTGSWHLTGTFTPAGA